MAVAKPLNTNQYQVRRMANKIIGHKERGVFTEYEGKQAILVCERDDWYQGVASETYGPSERWIRLKVQALRTTHGIGKIRLWIIIIVNIVLLSLTLKLSCLVFRACVYVCMT